jgi:hypothetical protein
MSIKLHIIGNSNVDRYFPIVKAAHDDPCIQNMTLVRATNLAQIKEAITPAVPVEARSHVLLACLTNPITICSYNDPRSMLKHCESVFTQIKAFIAKGRGAVLGDMEQVLIFKHHKGLFKICKIYRYSDLLF